ncbi:hypothetical protein EDB92DRAFT_1814492 [Lactarius akahatsu]|uniref:Uncharacterized protein n=1 Tax=Lactarius akahatsu TaxID=416441 RepID=A0AAD4LMK9_9AGAM|nr:hypothetical protein EDB92DRAFT_1814492 [Lactarius akahatsu]
MPPRQLEYLQPRASIRPHRQAAQQMPGTKRGCEAGATVEHSKVRRGIGWDDVRCRGTPTKSGSTSLLYVRWPSANVDPVKAVRDWLATVGDQSLTALTGSMFADGGHGEKVFEERVGHVQLGNGAGAWYEAAGRTDDDTLGGGASPSPTEVQHRSNGGHSPVQGWNIEMDVEEIVDENKAGCEEEERVVGGNGEARL